MLTPNQSQHPDKGTVLSNAILTGLEKRANTLQILLTLLCACLERCRSGNAHKGSAKVEVFDWSASVIVG